MKIDRTEQYTQERYDKAIGTKGTFMSNLWQLETPIVDEEGNEYWNSEGWYMAQRTPSSITRKHIAKASKISGGESRKARKKYPLEQNEDKRTQYMIDAVKKKFDNNPKLKSLLLATGIETEIIEKNYWHDTLFGVDDKTLQGANILGKVLMGYRDMCIHIEH